MQNNNLSYDNVFLPSKETSHGGLRLKNNKNQKFQFTIITVVLNDYKNIEETINSVISQKVNLEFIIIDGGSTDGTLEIIKKYDKFINLWISEKDGGIYHAMNKGILYSTGSFIGMINSGDLFSKNGLKIIENYINKNKNLDFIFGTVHKKILKYKFNPHKIIWSFDFYPSHSAGFFIKNETQRKLGLYDTNFKLSADHEFFYRLINKKFIGTSTLKNELVGIFRKVNTSFSSTFSAEEHLNEEVNIRLKHFQNRLIIMLIIFNNFIRKLFKKKKYRISLYFLFNKIYYVFKQTKNS